jgi:hypothetical protein
VQGKAIDDIKAFLKISLGTLLRFYNAAIPFEMLNEMKEDLIEAVSN